MNPYKTDEEARIRRERARQAIALAMENRWEEAVAVNRSIIDLFPADVEAYNRLGKAFVELGHYSEARDAFSRTLELSPYNSIAKRNLRRLSHLGESQTLPRDEQRIIPPRLFIEETGKSGVCSLQQLASKEVLAKMTAGEPAYLRIDGRSLIVVNSQEEYLGQVETKLALRLIDLLEGGNKYEAAITSIGEREVKIIIREVYRDPSQEGRLSFPFREADDFRSYVKEKVLKYELGEEDFSDDDLAAWDEREEPPQDFMSIEEEGPPIEEREEEEEELE